MSTPPFSLNTIVSESKRIINEHSLHFMALSAVFLLPISFSVTLYLTLKPQLLLLDQKSLILITLFYSAFVFVLSLCATSSITHSVFEGFYCRPVKFVSAIKSIFNSFLPLLITTSLCHLILSGVLVIFAVFLFSVLKLAQLVTFDQYGQYSSPYNIWPGLIVFLFVLVYLQVKWTLVPAVVVVESSWGVKALKRSSSLINEYKSMGLLLYLHFLVVTGLLVWTSSSASTTLIDIDIDIDGKWIVAFEIQILVSSILLITWLFLSNAAAITVLYIYCKADSEDFIAKDYVSLRFDDGKVPAVLEGY